METCQAQFVQIGVKAFQPAKIQSVYFESTGDVLISFDRTAEEGDMRFQGLAADAFMDWWGKANVHYLDPEWYKETDDDDKAPTGLLETMAIWNTRYTFMWFN